MITHEIITTKEITYHTPAYRTGQGYVPYHEKTKRRIPGISINCSKETYDGWLKTCGIEVGDILVRDTMVNWGDKSLWMCHIVVEIMDNLPPFNRNNWEGANPKVFHLLQCDSGTVSPWDRWESCIDLLPVPENIYATTVEPNFDKLRNYLDARGYTQVPINKAKPTVA